METGVLVVVPFTNLRPETVKSVPATARFVDVGSDDQAYWRLLRDIWEARAGFIVVEHDIVPPAGFIAGLQDCSEDWCCGKYNMNGIVSPALGCTKFSASLLERTAGLLDGILRQHRHWQSLDSMIIGELHRRRFTEHVHDPAVRHLHEPEKAEPRRYELTKLKFIGDGMRYLNAIPAADFETWDAEMVAICLESGLYVDVTPVRPERP